MRRLALLATLALALAAGSAEAYPLPGAPQCTVFPASSVWNKRVDRLPVAGNTSAIVGSIGAGGNVHADFGSGFWDGRPIGIPITVVSSSTPRSAVRFDYADESDRGPYPIPPRVRIEGGRQGTATGTHSLSTARAASSTSSSPSIREAARLAGARVRRHLEPALQPAPPSRLDVCRRGRASDPPRSGPLRRGCTRADRPRTSLHGRAVAAGLRLPCPPLRLEPHRPGSAPDGTPAPAPGGLPGRGLPAAGPDRPNGSSATA